MPTVSQLTKKNIIEAKKNKTIQWLDMIPVERQEAAIKLAENKRKEVRYEEKKKKF